MSSFTWQKTFWILERAGPYASLWEEHGERAARRRWDYIKSGEDGNGRLYKVCIKLKPKKEILITDLGSLEK